MKRNALTIGCIAMAGILFVSLLCATFLDKSLSSAMYFGKNAALAGAILGKLPAWTLGAFACAVLFHTARRKDRYDAFRIPMAFVYALGTAFCCVMFFYSITDELFSDWTKYLFSVLAGMGISLLVLYCASKIKAEKAHALRKWSFTVLFTVVTILAVITVLKAVWGRVRYEEVMIGAGAFTPWYSPQGITGNSSFPSGHTALAACMGLVVPLFAADGKLKKYSLVVLFCAVAFTVAIAVMRIMGGYHYLSDVTVSCLIALGVTILFSGIFYGKHTSEKDKFLPKWMEKL